MHLIWRCKLNNERKENLLFMGIIVLLEKIFSSLLMHPKFKKDRMKRLGYRLGYSEVNWLHSLKEMSSLTLEELSILNERKVELTKEHEKYLEKHPELKTLLSSFMCAVLMEKPNDVIEFAREHFKSTETTEQVRQLSLSSY